MKFMLDFIRASMVSYFSRMKQVFERIYMKNLIQKKFKKSLHY